MSAIWKIFCSFFALVAVGDAVIAFHSFQRFGDMHIAWGANSIAAAFFWLLAGFHKSLG